MGRRDDAIVVGGRARDGARGPGTAAPAARWVLPNAAACAGWRHHPTRPTRRIRHGQDPCRRPRSPSGPAGRPSDPPGPPSATPGRLPTRSSRHACATGSAMGSRCCMSPRMTKGRSRRVPTSRSTASPRSSGWPRSRRPAAADWAAPSRTRCSRTLGRAGWTRSSCRRRVTTSPGSTSGSGSSDSVTPDWPDCRAAAGHT